jgi:uncharacterized Zn finger protein
VGRSQESALEGILTPGVLLELAGARYFERGEGYHNRGLVRALIEHEGTVAAKVLGTHEYRVRLWAEGDELRHSCDCPLGMAGEFCKHCVAVGLASFEGKPSQNAPGGSVTMDDVRAYLEERDKDALVGIILEQAMEDERLRERLLLRASRVGGLDLATFRRVIDAAVDFDDDYGSPWDYTGGIENVIASIAELLEEGFAIEVIELSEYALAAVEGAMGYDVDGALGGILRDLEEIHHEACKRSEPDPKSLAKRLFEWELGGDYDTFFDAVNTYADVLGERGLAEYTRLAEEEWAGVPALGPDRENRPRYYGKRERLAEIMEALAQRSGDVEALVAIKSKDLSSAFSYLEIARIYKQAGDDEKALEWAEEGAWVFTAEGHPDLRRFLAEEYCDRGRHEKAIDLIWAEFIEQPCLPSYQRLRAYASRAGAWEHWRARALDFAREDIARKKRESKGYSLLLPVDQSSLVEILLWEGNVEDAWREAREGGCSEELWLELATRREEEHPEDSLAVYQERIEPLINRTNNKAYEEACGLLVRARDLMQSLDREAEFDEYLDLLRMEYKRKRNFMKLLDKME